jgi:hypothetical protein
MSATPPLSSSGEPSPVHTVVRPQAQKPQLVRTESVVGDDLRRRVSGAETAAKDPPRKAGRHITFQLPEGTKEEAFPSARTEVTEPLRPLTVLTARPAGLLDTPTFGFDPLNGFNNQPPRPDADEPPAKRPRLGMAPWRARDRASARSRSPSPPTATMTTGAPTPPAVPQPTAQPAVLLATAQPVVALPAAAQPATPPPAVPQPAQPAAPPAEPAQPPTQRPKPSIKDEVPITDLSATGEWSDDDGPFPGPYHRAGRLTPVSRVLPKRKRLSVDKVSDAAHQAGMTGPMCVLKNGTIITVTPPCTSERVTKVLEAFMVSPPLSPPVVIVKTAEGDDHIYVVRLASGYTIVLCTDKAATSSEISTLVSCIVYSDQSSPNVVRIHSGGGR